MVYIAYFTELNSKIRDYALKRRICRENCKYALDERFHGHFCPRRKAAKSCHPVPNQTFQTKPTKPDIPNQIKLSLPNILNQTYQTKITGQSSQHIWVRSAFGN